MSRGGPGVPRALYSFPQKDCTACGNLYTPLSSSQLRCGQCMALYYGMPDHVWRHLAKLKREGKGWECERCGEDLEVSILERSDKQAWETHHKDGDHGNDDLENIELLCFACHKKHHGADAHTPAGNAKRSELMKKKWQEGKYSDPKTKAGQSWAGRKHSPETLKRMSEARSRYWQAKHEDFANSNKASKG